MTTTSSGVLRVAEYRYATYKRLWQGSFVSTVINPILFLLAFGVGLGSLVDERTAESLEGVAYLSFVAPAMLATSAMFTGVNESSYAVLGGVKWVPTTHAQVATPITPAQACLGHLLWMVARVAMSVVAFYAVIVVAGATESWWVIAAVPVAVLTGTAFAACLQAWSVGRTTDTSFPNISRFVILPMFLFSGAFFPSEQLPDGVEWVKVLTPIWHGVELCRSLSLGTATLPGAALHLAVLAAFALVGAALGVHEYRKRLST
ncbi:MAG: ABC transporter permease [Actinomycetota bacterium]